MISFPEGFQSWMWRGLGFIIPFLIFGYVSITILFGVVYSNNFKVNYMTIHRCRWGFLASLPSLALCFQPRTGHFVWLLARSWIRKNADCFVVCSHNKIQFSLHFIKRHCFLTSTALPAVQCIHVIPSVLSPGMCWVAGKSIVADLQAHGISSIH